MKRVLLCIPSFAMGGAEKFAVDLATKLNKSKFEVTVAQTRNNVDSEFKAIIKNAGIKIVDLSGKTYLEMLRKQFDYLKKNKPTVVHANTGSILHVMLACWLCRVPKRLYTVHNEANLLFGNSKIKKLIYRLAFSFFGFIPVAICPTVKETLMREFGFSSKKIPVVNNGVDINKFHPERPKVISDSIQIISVGTLYWIKNQRMTINTICDLHNEGLNVSLDILGDGEDREKLDKLIKDRHAESYIVLHGIQKEVEKYLQKADIYVSASKTEGLPLSILEAMACGLPIVATNAGGSKDIVKNGINGFLIEVDDEDGLKEALRSIIKNRSLQNNYSWKSREIAETWSAENCTHGYEELYLDSE